MSISIGVIGTKVGYQLASTGATGVDLRSDRTAALVTTLGHPLMAEAAVGGRVFIGSNAVAGVAHGTALGTTPPLAVWNPPNSGYNLAIHALTVGYVSGTLGAGFVAIASIVQTTVPSTGTELTPACSLIGSPRGVGRVFTGSTISGTPAIVRPSFSYGPALATTAVFPYIVRDFIEGEIVVAPGQVLCCQGIGTAGTSPLLVFAFTWEEVPAI